MTMKVVVVGDGMTMMVIIVMESKSAKLRRIQIHIRRLKMSPLYSFLSAYYFPLKFLKVNMTRRDAIVY